MLTQDQISKLEKLITHKKFGVLLKAAIPNWKRFKPADRTFGVEERNGKYLRRKGTPGVCLIGAAIYNEKYGSRIHLLNTKFRVNENSYFSLLDGFDNAKVEVEDEAYKFAQKVRKIVINVDSKTTKKS